MLKLTSRLKIREQSFTMGGGTSVLQHANAVSTGYQQRGNAAVGVLALMAPLFLVICAQFAALDVFQLEHHYQATAAAGAVPLGLGFLPPFVADDLFTMAVSIMLVTEGVYLFSNGLAFELDVVECWKLSLCCINPANFPQGIFSWHLIMACDFLMGQFGLKIGGRRILSSPCEWCMIMEYAGQYTLIALKAGCQVVVQNGVLVRSTWAMGPQMGQQVGWALALALNGNTGLSQSGILASGSLEPNRAHGAPNPGINLIPNLRVCVVFDEFRMLAAAALGWRTRGGFGTFRDGQRAWDGCVTCIRQTQFAIFADAAVTEGVFARPGASVGTRYAFNGLLFRRTEDGVLLHQGQIDGNGGLALATEFANRITNAIAIREPGATIRVQDILRYPWDLGFCQSSGIVFYMRHAYPALFHGIALVELSDSESYVSSNCSIASQDLDHGLDADDSDDDMQAELTASLGTMENLNLGTPE
jgi:hypothetical protein